MPFFEMTPTYLNIALTKLLGGASLIMKFQVSLIFCHALTGGGHMSSKKTTTKILQCGFYWPTMFKDVHAFYVACDQCHRLKPYLENFMAEVETLDLQDPIPL